MAPPQSVDLPATLLGSIGAPGEKDTYQFEGKAGEDIVFRVQASEIGSKLVSALALSDTDGQVLASAGQDTNRRDAVLLYHLKQGGRYSITISDRDNGGGKRYFYRLDAGALPYVENCLPAGCTRRTADSDFRIRRESWWDQAVLRCSHPQQPMAGRPCISIQLAVHDH